jgi:hypothetical protein
VHLTVSKTSLSIFSLIQSLSERSVPTPEMSATRWNTALSSHKRGPAQLSFSSYSCLNHHRLDDGGSKHT